MKKYVFTFTLILLGIFAFGQISSKSTTTNSNLSISVSEKNSSYDYTASFDNEKTDKVRKEILKELGQPGNNSTRTFLWEGKDYSVQLKQGKVSIEFEKGTTTKSTQMKLKALGETISETLGSPKTPETPKPPKTK